MRSRGEKRSKKTSSRPPSDKTINEYNSDSVPQYFQVSVNVLEARKLAWSNAQTPGSYVIVVLGKKKHRTVIRKNSTEPCFRELFVFEMYVSMREVQQSSLWMAVMEPRCCAPPRLLGEATVDLGAIWAQPHHQVVHKWAQLCLPKDPEAGPVGFLKVDISITYRGEVQTVIPPLVVKEKLDDNLLLPSGSEQQRANYLITIFGAYNLPNNAQSGVHGNKRLGKPPSTFVRTSFCGLMAKTAVQYRNNNPIYCEQVSVVEMFPNMNQLIRLEVCSADGCFHKVIAYTDLKLNTISHDGENGFLPTFGPSLVHMYAMTCAGAINTPDEDGPYHRGALLVALKTIVPYYQHGVRSIGVEPIPQVQPEKMWMQEDFCIFAPILEISMLDRRVTGQSCGLAITIAEIGSDGRVDEGSNKLHYTGVLGVYKKKSAYGYTHFPNAFPVLQLAVRLPDFRFRMYRNNMIYGTVNSLEQVLSDVERRLKLFEYTSPIELTDELKRALDDATGNIMKFLDIVQYYTESTINETLQQNSTELDKKQLTLQKEEIEKIFQLISRKTKEDSAMNFSYEGCKGTRENLVGTRKGVKILLAETKSIAQNLQSVIFKTCDGWPEIVVWLLNGNGSRVAYTKILPGDVIYSVIPEQCGRNCGHLQTIYLKPLKCPSHSSAMSLGCHCIAAKVEVQFWMGLFTQKCAFDHFIPPGYSLNMNKFHEIYLKTGTMMLECRTFVYRAKLISYGENSKEIFPFLRVNCLNSVKDTKVIPKTWTPVWNQVISIQMLTYMNLERLASNPPIVLIEVFDKELSGKLDLIGRAAIEPVFDERNDYENAPKLQWIDIHKGAEHTGQILISAQILQLPERLLKTTEYDPNEGTAAEEEEKTSQTDVESLPENLLPKSNSYKVDIYWWGLRDVNITRKPCVVLEIDDLNVKSEIIGDIKSSSNFPHGRTSHTFESPLNELYSPSMSVRLYDSSTFGRTMFLGTNAIKNPNKFIVKWLPKSEREACLKSVSIISADFRQINQSLFLKKCKKSSENVNDCTSSLSISSWSEANAQRSAWRRLFTRRQLAEEEYTLLPVYAKQKDQIKVLRKSHKAVELNDWWTRFYHSQSCKQGEDTTHTEKITIYNNELELQPEFAKFKDWCSTLKLYNGKRTGVPEKDAQLQCGHLKAGIAIYRWPPPEHTVAVSCTGVDLMKGFFEDHPRNDPTKLLVRVYIIKATNLCTKDFTGKSDPYVVVSCGKKHLGDRNSYVPNTVEPVFGKMYEFRCTLPEDYLLRVSLYDYDAIPPDNLIGSTSIDLEDRLYTKHRARVGLSPDYTKTGPAKWRDCVKPSLILEEICSRNHTSPPEFPNPSTVAINGVEYKDTNVKYSDKEYISPFERKENICLSLLRNWQTLPICGYHLVPEHVETRNLSNPDKPGFNQGKLQLWVDIYPIDTTTNIPPPCDITPKKLEKYELRVIIWDVKSMIMNNYGETGKIWKSVDLYVRTWIGCVENAQHTDVHYNSLDGEGKFNWRMIFHFLYQHTERKIYNSETGPFTEYEEYTAPILVVQLLESDADECLGSLALDLNCMPRGVKYARQCTIGATKRCKRISLFDWTSVRAWWPLKLMDNTSDREITAGVVDMELTLLPYEKACAMPVGIGREPPLPLTIPCRPCYKESPFSDFLANLCCFFENSNEQILIVFVIAVIFCIIVYLAISAQHPLFWRF